MVEAVSEESRRRYEEARQREDERTISDEDIERTKARIGVEIPVQRPDWRECYADALFHYCQGIGDDNPLYWDEEYGRQTRWGGILAPPMFIRNMGISRVKEIPAEVRQRGEHALSGVHGWYSGDEIEFLQPIRVGDQLTVRRYVKDVIVKRSEFAGTTVHQIRRSEWVNQLGNLVAVSDNLLISGGRQSRPGERQKYAGAEPASYTPEQIQQIARDYRQEVRNRRGATPRLWEDVVDGEEMPAIQKGPLTVSDIIAWDVGDGLTMIKGAHRLMFLDYLRHPNAYSTNEAGVPDIVERVHWDHEMGRRTGNPGAYDYGAQRVAWMAHLVTDWVGDDGWMRKLSVQFRKFNYVGDTTWLRGKVVRKYVEAGESRVDLELWAEDQRGRQTTIGQAVAQLPSRERGPVRLPAITPDWW